MEVKFRGKKYFFDTESQNVLGGRENQIWMVFKRQALHFLLGSTLPQIRGPDFDERWALVSFHRAEPRTRLHKGKSGCQGQAPALPRSQPQHHSASLSRWHWRHTSPQPTWISPCLSFSQLQTWWHLISTLPCLPLPLFKDVSIGGPSMPSKRQFQLYTQVIYTGASDTTLMPEQQAPLPTESSPHPDKSSICNMR